ncbi:MAG: methyl-accepting chemotaxis protein [Desulfobacterales bacterium]
MKNMKLGSKLIGMTLIILTFMLLSSVFGICRLTQIRKQIRMIAHVHIELSEAVAEMNSIYMEQTHLLERVLRYAEIYHARDESKKKAYDICLEKYREHVSLIHGQLKEAADISARGLQSVPTERERKEFESVDGHLHRIGTDYEEYVKFVSPIFDMLESGKLADAEKYSLETEKKEDNLRKEIKSFLEHIEELSLESAKQAESEGGSAFKWMSVFSAVLTVLGLLFSILITRWITGSLDRIIEGLAESSDQIVSAAQQASASSQSLAQGASRQSASVRETASALEELSSMTMQNAASAKQAGVLRKDSLQSLNAASTAMQETVEAMNRIKASGEEIGKIIKSIDEIAFQTNLLALNAAVEAARAGESGAGFAVVAGEVRNLAMRSAEASRDTQNLIHKNVEEIGAGSQLIEKTRNAFILSIDHNEKVGRLVDEISAASIEQSERIGQIRRAAAEIESVTHQNAANAQQSASASEELNAQAEQLKQMAKELLLTVKGKADRQSLNIGKKKEKKAPIRNLAEHAGSETARPDIRRSVKPGKEEVKPEQLIPLDEDEFSDF